MAKFKLNEVSYRRIMGRQAEDHWANEYDAAIHATPSEAPSTSIATIVRHAGREVHLLSESELKAWLLAIFNPQVWEIQEQRILSPGPREHPLVSHPRASGLRLPGIRGTVEIASELGMLTKHPRFLLREGDNPQEWKRRAFPYVGDLLLFLEDDRGPFVVNWSVKDKARSFRKRAFHSRPQAIKQEEDSATLLRHRLEEIYYLDAGIPTYQIAGERIDRHLYWNLRTLFCDLSYSSSIGPAERVAAIDVVREQISTGRPGYRIAGCIADIFGIELRDAVAIIHQAIWTRELRVDLYSPVTMDRPLQPETRDPLIAYQDWFRRATP